ncbi:HWE histidine kinase domain-containing protein [Litoreibacter roseus]|uniref:histidine kinase n=1 Tax=Litoreibacter roseus TaxID=2601869 RepID=A0A6N6JFQ7_9RHOB|nr:HWE histidine kinase domain-containing protein [Litoreibacter roseus]GFE65193.1 signal transduction histidine kinase [Litoreibacter roseus]
MDDYRDQSGIQLDLNTCDLEPIHTPGRIQPFGVLLAGPSDFSKIDYCSANVVEYFDVTPKTILGSPFAELFGVQLVHDLRNLASISTARTQRERVGRYDLPQGEFEVYLHVNSSDQAVVEFETCVEDVGQSLQSPIDQTRKYLSAVSARETIAQMLEVSVSALSALTGFDRVMAYRYEANGDGEVVAERRNSSVDSFLGLRYPAWDVPEQARALQVKNPLRMLVDVAQSPVPVFAFDEKSPPLDMALAHLRGISPIHVEYLSNMGVGATLTLGLIVDGKLWGMFACHHQSSKIVSSDVRIAVELFGQMVSLLIKQRLDLEDTVRRHKAAEARERVLAETDAKTDLLHSFPDLAPILGQVIDCDGLAITYEGKTLTYRSTPSNEAIAAIGMHDPDNEDVVYAVTNLSQCKLIDKEDLGHSAGTLLIRATAAYPMQLFFFRDEKIRKLNWAGKPEKQMEAGPLGPRITPRGSFDAYVESQKGFSDPWESADLAAARELQILLTQITAKGERVQLMRHKDLVSHQRQQDLMIAELNHRVKNILALIRSLSRQAKASSASLESYAIALEQRISALAAAHDLAVSNSMKGVSLRGILKTELDPFLDEDSSQVLMSGPLVGLRADVAPMIALVLHEIVSNAVKYGALSTEAGIVRIKWSVSDSRLHFSWRELGGPNVADPERHGFGRSLIEKAIPFELDGDTKLSFEPAGVQFEFDIPDENLVELEGETTSKLVGSVAKIEKAATGKTVLLVEDNVVLAMDMMESLTRIGTEHVETASSYPAGLKLVEKGGFDFAVLDMNLRGTVSFGIAERLIEQGIPFVFVTGYGSSIDLPKNLGAVPILTKPVDEGTLSKCIQDLLS